MGREANTVEVRVPDNVAVVEQQSGPGVYYSTGSPEGVVTAPVGSVCWDKANGTQYNKLTGTGNTGWTAPTTSTVEAAFPIQTNTSGTVNAPFGSQYGSILIDGMAADTTLAITHNIDQISWQVALTNPGGNTLTITMNGTTVDFANAVSGSYNANTTAAQYFYIQRTSPTGDYIVNIVEGPTPPTPQIDVMSFASASGSYLDVSSLIPDDIQAFSFSILAWVQLTSATDSTTGSIFAHRTGNGIVQLLDRTDNTFTIFGRDDGNNLVTGTGNAQTTNWTHLGMVWDSGARTLTLYENAVQTAQVTIAGTAITAADTRIGTDAIGTASFNGNMYDAQIYNSALTAGNISTIHAAGNAGATVGTPLARYVSSEVDSSTNGNNAVNNNVTTVQVDEF